MPIGPKPTVVIVESPAKCKKIENFLGPGYVVLASFGHLTTLKSLKDIDISKNYKPSFNIIDSCFIISPPSKTMLSRCKLTIN